MDIRSFWEAVLNQNEVIIDEENGQTVYTEDGEPSAQWEVQVAVTDDGCEVLAYQHEAIYERLFGNTRGSVR